MQLRFVHIDDETTAYSKRKSSAAEELSSALFPPRPSFSTGGLRALGLCAVWILQSLGVSASQSSELQGIPSSQRLSTKLRFL